MSKIRRFTPVRILVFTFLALWTLSFFGGFLWLVLNSLKDRVQYVVDKVGLPEQWLWSNYIKAFTELSASEKSVPIMIWNSVWRVGASIVITQLSGNMFMYCLAKYKFPGRDLIYWLIIVTMMIPVYGTMGASLKYQMMMNMYDTPLHVFIGAISIGGLIQYSCYKNLSWTYAEAAFLDGANHYTVFWKVMLPQMIPLITALSVTAFIGGWNDYMDTIVYMPSYVTLAAGLYIYENESVRAMNYPVLFAGLIVCIVPVIILFVSFQNTFLEIDISGGLKG